MPSNANSNVVGAGWGNTRTDRKYFPRLVFSRNRDRSSRFPPDFRGLCCGLESRYHQLEVECLYPRRNTSSLVLGISRFPFFKRPL